MANTGIIAPTHTQLKMPRDKDFHSGVFSFSNLHIGLGPPCVPGEKFCKHMKYVQFKMPVHTGIFETVLLNKISL